VERGWVAPTAARPLGPLFVSAAGRGVAKATRIAGARGGEAGGQVVGGAGLWGGAEFKGRWEVAEE
jgi:hypothetical protein